MKYILILFIIIVACSAPKETTKVNTLSPVGNLTERNDSLSQIAPIERPNYYYGEDLAKFPYQREVLQDKDSCIILSSSQIAASELSLSFIEESWRDYLTSNIESISFLSKDRGFITFSHPFAPEFAKKYNINLKSQSGGTDIYEFALNPEKGFEFENLAPLEALNTSFWESHPFAGDTLLPNGDRITLLLWSSDRDKPYSKMINKDGEVKVSGNTDLFYAFRVNDDWGSVKKFEKINNDANQGSPFIYCLCGEESTLFYSSNEDGSANDYDIFYTIIKIDYINQNIEEIKKAERFTKLGKDSLSKQDSLTMYELINSKYDERFPYIPYPYKDELKLYFSSNRFSKKTKINDSTALKAKGGYDIYGLDLDSEVFPCAPAEIKINYHLTVLNSANPEEEIPKQIIKVNNGAKEVSKKGNTTVYSLEADNEYSAYGGSEFSDSGFDCLSLEDGVLAGFIPPKIDESQIEYEQVSKSEIVKKEIGKSKVNFGDTETKILYDTLNYNGIEFISKDVRTSTVISIDKENNTYSVQETSSKMKAKNTSINLLLGEKYKMSENEKFVDGAEVPSLLTLKEKLNTNGIKTSTNIYDTVYLAPVYKDAYDITLKVYVVDKCTGEIVYNPMASLINSKGEKENKQSENRNYLEFNLKCGENYRLLGGSNYKYNAKGEIDFPSQPFLRYFAADDFRILANEAVVRSEKTKRYELNTNSIKSDIMLSDTIFLNATPNIAYTIELENAKRKKEQIKEPIILVRNISTGKDLKIEKAFFKFYPNPNHKYKIYGGSNYLGDECEDNKSYIVRGYYAPKFENGVYKLNLNYENLNLNEFTKVNGAMVPSLYSYSADISIIGNEECKSKEIKDIVYLIPEEYIKPPCSIEFVNFEGYHRNVPYFQTGFWEVNTAENYNNHIERLEDGFEITPDKIKRNRSEYIVSNEAALYPIIKNDGLNYSIANARWIELHPNNYYWGWRPDLYNGASKERVEKRNVRKEEYKTYANQVSENLDIMAKSILNDVLPKFEEVQKLNPENTGTKLLIEIKALSDKRGVERGWYIGNKDINYKAGFYDRYSDRIITRNIAINAPKVNEENKTVSDKVNLGLNNRVLSDLRAWYGYQEIMKRVKDDNNFKKYLDNGKVVTPENYKSDLSEYDIIILANGEDIDEYAEAKIKMYDKSKRKLSYFTYDQTRRVEVIISIVSYQNGKVIKSDCCDEDAEFSNK